MSSHEQDHEGEVGSAATLAGAPPENSGPAVAPANEFPVDKWDRYEFVRLLGRGGMGAVYMARDLRLGRVVALKFLRTEDPETARRFQREARAQASIDHPLICKVFEVGEIAGKAYIAMQCVEGESLDRARVRLSLAQKVQVSRDVAEALHAAHRQGVIHRDIKPANIMIEIGDDGRLRPIVMDFGIARESGVNSGMTEDGAVMGTPAYMSPEQARGEVSEISRRTDVYSLGATLYELLTGKPPFAGNSLIDILVMVARDEPTPPRELVRSIPADLETITLKCLSKEPSQRYDSAKALAEDLQRYISGDPIVARKSSFLYRIQKRLRKHKALFAISCASLVGISALGVDEIKSRRASERKEIAVKQQVSHARQLGQDIKELEWFMRTVYSLPLHDISYEQGLVRTRMERIARQPGNVGAEDESLAHYALGRGYLALREPQRAYEHLMNSWNNGNRSAELHYAIGRALGQRYEEALRVEQSNIHRRLSEDRWQTIQKELLGEALLHLEQSRSVELEAASYLDALIALYKRQFDTALKHSNIAIKQSPWLYEATKLKADILYERWLVKSRNGKEEKEEASLLAALKLYDQATTVGRSDVILHEARAAAWHTLLITRYDQGRPLEEFIPSAISAYQDAITASPQRPNGYQLATSVQLTIAQNLLDSGRDPRPQVKEMITLGENAIRRGADNEIINNTLGSGITIALFYEEANRQPHSVSVNDAIKYFHRSIEINPKYLWAYNDLAGAYLVRAVDRMHNLENPIEDLLEALRNTEQIITRDPEYVIAYSNSIFFHYMIANYLLEHGRDPRIEIKAGVRQGAACLARNRKISDCHSNLALLHLTSARYYLNKSEHSDLFFEALQHTITNLQDAETLGDKSLEHQQTLGAVYVLKAQQEVSKGQDLTVTKNQALNALQACQKLSAKDELCAILTIELELMMVNAGQALGGSQTKALNHALIIAEQVVKNNSRSANGQRMLAEVRLTRARKLSAINQQSNLDAELQAGFAAIERSLVLNPDNPQAQNVRAALAAQFKQKIQ